jgi:quercetin dioxygenase-like cupin family protein
MSIPPKNITLKKETEGQSISVVGDTYRVIIPGRETAGNYAVIDMLVPPGGGPGPHAHALMQETFYVVDGEVEFKTESGKQVAKKGSFIHIPLGGAVHCFKNTSDTIAHLLCTVMPAGLDEFFLEIGRPVEAGRFLEPPELSLDNLQKLKTIAEKYGQQLYPPDFLG